MGIEILQPMTTMSHREIVSGLHRWPRLWRACLFVVRIARQAEAVFGEHCGWRSNRVAEDSAGRISRDAVRSVPFRHNDGTGISRADECVPAGQSLENESAAGYSVRSAWLSGLAALFALLPLCASAANPTGIFQTDAVWGQPLTNAAVLYEPLAPVFQSNRIVALIPFTNRTDWLGVFTNVVVPGNYRVTLSWKNPVNNRSAIDTVFTNCIPDVSDTIYLLDPAYICTSTAGASNTVGYSQNAANARFIPKLNGTSSNLTLYATGGPAPSAGMVLTRLSSGIGVWSNATSIGAGSDLSVTNALVGTNAFTQATNYLSTNFAARANNGSDFGNKRVVGTNIGIAYLSPAGGNDATSDMMKAGVSYDGQLGISSTAGGNYPYLWFSRGTSGTGTNVWGVPLQLPGGIIGDSGFVTSHNPHMPPKGGTININQNGGPYLASLTNASGDTYVFIRNVNPWQSGSSLGLVRMATNQTYGVGGVLFTNVDGVPIYEQLYEGLQFVCIPEPYIARESNQAPSNVIIPGTRYPFYISFNADWGGDGLNQRAMFALDTRGFTNTTLPLVGGFPLQVPNAWALTNSHYLWALAVNESNGVVSVTNNAIIATNIWITSTNVKSFIIGKGFEPGDNVPMVVNGSAQFNSINGLTGYYDAWTWDAGGSDRFGIIVQSGNYPKLVHASGAPFIVGRSSGSDLQTSISGQTITDEFTILADGAGITNAVAVNNGGAVTNWGAVFNKSNSSWGVSATGGILASNHTNGLTIKGIASSGQGNTTKTNDFVGLGTNNPQTSLHLVSGSAAVPQLRVDATNGAVRFQAGTYNGGATQVGAIWLGDVVPNSANYVLFGASGSDTAINSPSGNVSIQGNSITRMTILNAGNVGIGTVGPAAKLEVSNAVGSATGPIFHAGTNASNGLTVDTNGNVGVHKSVPTVAMDVIGAVTASGNISGFQIQSSITTGSAGFSQNNGLAGGGIVFNGAGGMRTYANGTFRFVDDSGNLGAVLTNGWLGLNTHPNPATRFHVNSGTNEYIAKFSSTTFTNAAAISTNGITEFAVGTIFRTNAQTAANIEAALNNGDFWQGNISNMLQVAYKTNNTVLWKPAVTF